MYTDSITHFIRFVKGKDRRRGDIVSIYGFALCAILIGADEEGGKVAADRIVSTYAAHFPSSLYTMKYEMQEIR